MQTQGENWNLLGHEWAVDLLRGHLTNGRFRHAYLITGPQGVGRRTLAIRLAQALNCSQPVEEGVPCGECRACKWIERMQHPDLVVIQAEEGSNTLKVEQIREMQRTLSLAPYEAAYKIALLLRFEEANPSAANALLKTLEEPPPQVVMLMTASDAEALLPTIVSRCEVIRLRPLSLDLVSEGLQTRWGLPAEEARLLAHISGGRPGYAYRLSQNPEMLRQRQNQLDDLFRLLTASRVERFSYVEELSKDRDLIQNTLQSWLTLWRDVLLRNAGAITPLTNIDREKEIEALSKKLSLAEVKQMAKTLEATQAQLDRNTNTRLTLEVLMLDTPTL
jgi:DNA polymerase-3 subunit delta'